MSEKKSALIAIWDILKENSDFKHPLTQEEIGKILLEEYGIKLERKAISRNIDALIMNDVDVIKTRNGCFLESREFSDSELRLLIDSVLSSKHIPSSSTNRLISKLCSFSNKYFKSCVKHVKTVDLWNKTNNPALFYNIELIDDAINRKRQIKYDYNKYGIDKKLHKSSEQIVSPYQLIIHNQRYYLLAYSEYWHNMVFHRLDKMSNAIILQDDVQTKIRDIPGYEAGIDYSDFNSALPYMYVDRKQRVIFFADKIILDQIVDWFGKDITIEEVDENRVKVSVIVSLKAMEYWVLQYIKYVEVFFPPFFRKTIKEDLEKSLERYK